MLLDRAALTIRSLVSWSIRAPVGFWKSGIRYANRGAVCAMVAAISSASQALSPAPSEL